MAETVTMPKLGFDMAEGTLVRWVIQERRAGAERRGPGRDRDRQSHSGGRIELRGLSARHLVQAGESCRSTRPIAIIAAPGEKVDQRASRLPPREAVPSAAAVRPCPGCRRSPPRQAASRAGSRLRRRAPARRPAGLAAGAPHGAEMRINLARCLAAVLPGASPARYRGLSAGPAPSADSGCRRASRSASRLPQPAKAAPAPLPLLRLCPPLRRRRPDRPAQPAARRHRPAHGRSPSSRRRISTSPMNTISGLLMELRKQSSLAAGRRKALGQRFHPQSRRAGLRQFPNLNAALQGDQVVRFGAVNIGVAVAVENGLLTVVMPRRRPQAAAPDRR